MITRRAFAKLLSVGVPVATASAIAIERKRYAAWMTVDQMKVCRWRDDMHVDWTQTQTRTASNGDTWTYYRCQRDA